jgi:hypothetical protein
MTLIYDGWNRLAEIKIGGTVVGVYEYDGLNRRVKKHVDTDSPAPPTGWMTGNPGTPYMLPKTSMVSPDSNADEAHVDE